MKKKMISALLCIAILFTLSVSALAVDESPAAATEGQTEATPAPDGEAAEGDGEAEASPSAEPKKGTQKIETVEDLLAMAKAGTGKYILANDLDMTGVSWTPCAFTGTLDGDGHALYNLAIAAVGEDKADTVDGNDKVYETVFSGFFSVLKDATIKDFHICGENIAVTTEENCYVGGLAGYMSNTEIKNCSVKNAQISLTSSNYMTGIGGLVGFGGGTIAECETSCELVLTDKSAADILCEEFMGGILANGNVTLTDSIVDINGYASVHGYVHNGGLIGMFYLYDKTAATGTITGCTVNGQITFFEDNTDRRAYCQAFVGELLTWTNMGSCSQTFVPNEVFDYTVDLVPERCATPNYSEEITAPSCETWGYTTHKCAGCERTWNDTFTLPQHTAGEWEVTKDATYTEPGVKSLLCSECSAVMETAEIPPHVDGEWITVKEATYGADGLRQLFCADCGVLLKEEVIPMLVPVSTCNIDESEIKIDYKASQKLSVTITPDNATNPMVYWKSSDESIVSVDTDGTIHANGRGEATVTCTSADGFAAGQAKVTVSYSAVQWIIVTILFGWIWY